ncbi:MAG: folate-binding protein YgfZ [Alphaproteobacteria bacterium]|nr:folate-binding protein YgfZ [Alphaproteobacteria bacterium]MBT5860985.1 folate-binding protein YgfZ [Alphaproteobacteria bacterium]
MNPNTFTMLPGRGLLGVGGGDAIEFLQNLVSNDVEQVGADTSVYGLLLTAQGKFLHDFFIARLDERTLVLDCESDRLEDLERRLTLYRLRSDVTLTNFSDTYSVAAAFGDGALAALGLSTDPGNTVTIGDGIAMTDPRLGAMGARIIMPVADLPGVLTDLGFQQDDGAAYHAMRLSHGVPDSSADIAVDKGFPLESGLDHLNAIDFTKGCYVGQELTARTHYRGTIRKRLYRVDVDGPTPPPGSPVTLGDKPAGDMRSGQDGIAMAMLRLEYVAQSKETGEAFTAGDARLTAVAQEWFGEDAAADSP